MMKRRRMEVGDGRRAPAMYAHGKCGVSLSSGDVSASWLSAAGAGEKYGLALRDGPSDMYRISGDIEYDDE